MGTFSKTLSFAIFSNLTWWFHCWKQSMQVSTYVLPTTPLAGTTETSEWQSIVSEWWVFSKTFLSYCSLTFCWLHHFLNSLCLSVCVCLSLSRSVGRMGDATHWLESWNSNPKTLGSIPWSGRVKGSVFVSLRVNSCADLYTCASAWPPFECMARTQICAHATVYRSHIHLL